MKYDYEMLPFTMFPVNKITIGRRKRSIDFLRVSATRGKGVRIQGRSPVA